MSHQARVAHWREPEEPDRDARAVRYVSRKGAGRERLAPGGGRGRAWGGALQRVTVGGVGPVREDGYRHYADVPGRYVPIGFARYEPPLIDPNDYVYYRMAGWRIALPRAMPVWQARGLLFRIYYGGPQAAGYVRLGDTLVPASLEPGDRMTLSQTAVDFEAEPLA